MMTDQTPREHQAENSEPSLSQSELEEKSERLHIHDHDRKDFTSFCQRAGLPTAFRYLNLLDEVFKILDVARNARLGVIKFATGQTIEPCEKINTAAKIRALESPLVVGETISRNIIEPPILALDVVQKGFNSEYTLDKARDGTDNKAPDGMDIDSPPDDMKTLDKAPKTSNKAPNIPDSRPVELKEFPGAIPVARFLETLTGISANTLPLGSIASEQKKRLLEEGMMHWNHFIQCTKTPTTESLMEGLHRGVAMQCQHSQKAFDQVLTIYLKERSRDFLEPKNISFCGVQVKNVPHDTAAQIHIPVVDDP
ncbi:hypothetical protein PtA15_8A714 [Puccinia triticina]|uniref:Uncharacterized protein n=1 Tax=Puccinia triticina TaxID=208348 RepID=A0ABY7CYL3_9BASI|nr:uncharacterized protein PtA15_8A714 [Puccinia triticina]WAQ87807.1 hypothetical protein PtA15_8A714 [Puccinia triticina]